MKETSWLICALTKLCSLALIGITLLGNSKPAAAIDLPLPKVQRNGMATQLMVDGRPYIALAGEVHNSTASSPAFMAPVWNRLATLHVNTVVSPVYWELVEPTEGHFDFSLIDEQLRQARARQMRIVFLWFGTLKNAKSTYAPAWVRADQRRFSRAVINSSASPFADGDSPISVFGDAIVVADARAFSRLLAHLRKFDAQHTVIAIQVENETGILGDSRDRSEVANKTWNSKVPSSLIEYLLRNRDHLEPTLDAVWKRNGYRNSGTWEEVFGKDWQGEEVFMAWAVSTFVNRVASAGKAELALPMYANAWLGPQKPDDPAGRYPSGGPIPRVFDIWKAGAPKLDWLSPDIYLGNFREWAAAYARPDNPLFVPEALFEVGNLFEAIGSYRGIGFSAFGIEDGLPNSQLAEAYKLLEGIRPLIADAQARGTMMGAALKPGESREQILGDFVISVRGQREVTRKILLDIGVPLPSEEPPVRHPQTQSVFGVPELTDTRPSGMVLQLGGDEFLVIGKDLEVSIASKGEPRRKLELAYVEEGQYVNGRWVAGRVLNGDERLAILPTVNFGMVKLKVMITGRQGAD